MLFVILLVSYLFQPVVDLSVSGQSYRGDDGFDVFVINEPVTLFPGSDTLSVMHVDISFFYLHLVPWIHLNWDDFTIDMYRFEEGLWNQLYIRDPHLIGLPAPHTYYSWYLNDVESWVWNFTEYTLVEDFKSVCHLVEPGYYMLSVCRYGADPENYYFRVENGR